MAAGCGMVQVASKVRKRRYSRRLASARYPQIPVALPGAAGKRRQGPVSSDRTPVALRVAQDLRGIRRPRGRVSAAKPSACSVAGCGRRCAESTRGRPVFIALTKQKAAIKSYCTVPLYCTTVGLADRQCLKQSTGGPPMKRPHFKRASKATSPQNDRFKAIRTATMGDEEIADEGVPRSAYELQALAIHARNQSFDSCRGGAKECV
jgi:hypothetical protein